jgi:alkylation response protein AidB-like acyl-CoA dehydrogenase
MTDEQAALPDLDEVIRVGSRDADCSEAQARLSEETVEQLRRAGLFRMCVPRSLGGAELVPASVLSTIERLSAVDGALGWSAMIASTSGVISGQLAPEVAARIYTADGLVVGPFAPLGRARVLADGYRVSGRWPYASLCQASSWIMAGATLDDGQRRLVFAPAAEFEIHRTWSVMGMCATGSHDVELVDAVVPAELSVSLAFEAPRQSGPLYAFPVFGLLAASIATVSLGIARGSVDYLIELATLKTPTYSVRRLSERPAVQVAIACSLARLGSARGLLHEAVCQAWEEARERGSVGVDARLSLRLAAVQAAGVAAEVVTEMYRAGGGSSVYRSNPGQRRFRDVHTATQHAMVSPAILEVVGRRQLGLRIDESQI